MRAVLSAWLLGLAMPLLAADSGALAARCADCHRPDFPHGVLPLLDGQHAPYLKAQLRRFAESHREGFPMESIAAALDDATMDALALHFAARPPPLTAWTLRPALVEYGRSRAEALACAACHGSDFSGADVVPRLSQQAPAYIEAQLHGIRDGRRYHPPTATGARIADLDDTDARALSHFIAAAARDRRRLLEAGAVQPSD